MKKRYTLIESVQLPGDNGGRLAAGEAIDLNGLASGFYMLIATKEDGSVSPYKFTVK